MTLVILCGRRADGYAPAIGRRVLYVKAPDRLAAYYGPRWLRWLWLKWFYRGWVLAPFIAPPPWLVARGLLDRRWWQFLELEEGGYFYDARPRGWRAMMRHIRSMEHGPVLDRPGAR